MVKCAFREWRVTEQQTHGTFVERLADQKSEDSTVILSLETAGCYCATAVVYAVSTGAKTRKSRPRSEKKHSRAKQHPAPRTFVLQRYCLGGSRPSQIEIKQELKN
jgi:hypothetical protein